MIDLLKNKLGLNNNISIVGVFDNKDNQSYFHGVITIENNELKVVSFESNILDINSIDLDKNTPLIIAFTGHGIVYSKGNSSVINNNNKDDYYVTEYQTQTENFIAFSRKDKVEKTINHFTDKEFYILDIYIGVFVTNLLYNKIFDLDTITVTDIQLNYNDNDYESHKKIEFNSSYKVIIDNEKKSTIELFLLAIGFHYYYPSEKLVNIYVNDTINSNKEDFQYKKQFELIAKIGFVVFLLSLLINYIIKQQTTNKINTLTSVVSNTINYQNEYNLLNNEKNRKLEVIQMAGFLNSNYLSFYINEIGAILPKDIILNKLDVLPINKTINKDKQIEINDRQIFINGTTLTDNSFNTFLKRLKDKKWVNNIEIINYQSTKNSKSNFKLEVKLK